MCVRKLFSLFLLCLFSQCFAGSIELTKDNPETLEGVNSLELSVFGFQLGMTVDEVRGILSNNNNLEGSIEAKYQRLSIYEKKTNGTKGEHLLYLSWKDGSQYLNGITIFQSCRPFFAENFRRLLTFESLDNNSSFKKRFIGYESRSKNWESPEMGLKNTEYCYDDIGLAIIHRQAGPGTLITTQMGNSVIFRLFPTRPIVARREPESANKMASDVPKGFGSGFVISTDGYFLTCSHVIDDAREIKVRIGGKTYPAKVVRTDRRNDVALLKLEGSDFRPLSLSPSPPDMGDKVFTVGFPNPEIQGASAKYTDGAISALTGILDDIRTMQVTVPIQGGNSGGALVDAAGNVVGLVVAQLNAVKVFEYTGAIPQNVNFAVKINYALPLIQAVPGLSRRLAQQTKAGASASPIKTVEAAAGFVIVYE